MWCAPGCFVTLSMSFFFSRWILGLYVRFSKLSSPRSQFLYSFSKGPLPTLNRPWIQPYYSTMQSIQICVLSILNAIDLPIHCVEHVAVIKFRHVHLSTSFLSELFCFYRLGQLGITVNEVLWNQPEPPNTYFLCFYHVLFIQSLPPCLLFTRFWRLCIVAELTILKKPLSFLGAGKCKHTYQWATKVLRRCRRCFP